MPSRGRRNVISGLICARIPASGALVGLESKARVVGHFSGRLEARFARTYAPKKLASTSKKCLLVYDTNYEVERELCGYDVTLHGKQISFLSRAYFNGS